MARSAFFERANGWIQLCKVLFYPITALLGRRRFIGKEQLQRPGGILLVGNHVSHLDPVYNAVFVRKAGRWPRFLAKASLWKVPVAGTILRGTQQIAVERDAGAGKQVLDVATAALNKGQVVVIYPEGTITRDPDFWPMKPKAGVAMLALSGDFSVIPMATWGTQKVFVPYVKESKFRPLPRKDITVKCGEPLDLSEYRGKPVDSRAIRDVSLLIMGAVRDLVAEVRQEEPPKAFFIYRKPKLESAPKASGMEKPVSEAGE